MPIRSMTGFAQVKGQAGPQLAFTLSLKSVNHRFLDLHFRLPAESDDLEMKLRRLVKEKMARGHVEVTLNVERSGGAAFSLNREIVGGYIQAFRTASAEFGLAADPDLNAVLRMPGVLEAGHLSADGELLPAVLGRVEEGLAKLNRMREEEGRGIERELRQRMSHVQESAASVESYCYAMVQSYTEKLNARMQELIGN